MKNTCNRIQKSVRKTTYILRVFGLLGIALLFLASCSSNWALSPRDRSIKEWEAQHRKEEQSLDSIQKKNNDSQDKSLNLKG